MTPAAVRAIARLMIGVFSDWSKRRRCRHVLVPVYHSWECKACGRTFHD